MNSGDNKTITQDIRKMNANNKLLKKYINKDDDTYLYGQMYAYEEDTNIIEPYYSCKTPTDMLYDNKSNKKYLSECYISKNKYIVYEIKLNFEFMKNLKLVFKKYEIDSYLYEYIWGFVNNFNLLDISLDYYDYKLIRIVDTATCGSDDNDIYEIHNNQLTKIIINYKGNRCILTCSNNIISNIEYIGRNFSIPYEINEDIPNLDEIYYN